MIEIQNLYKSYGSLEVLKDISFKIEKGDIFGIIGQSGAGKSTLLRCFNGLENFQKGEVIVDGQAISSLNKKQMSDIQKEMGMIFQNFNLLNRLNVYDNINYFCGLYIRDKKQRKQYVDDAINLVGLNDFKKFLPKQLSGGLLRRLNIACGIAHKPKLIFLDEPTVAVDPQSRNHILDGIKKLRDQGATIVYTTHYMEEVEILCDRIIILDKGKIIAQGTSDELKKEANIEEKIERVGPTLNDIFLKLTGKELRD